MSRNQVTWNISSTQYKLMAVFTAYFTSFFILNSLNTALPKIAAELNGMSLYSTAVAIPALASAFVTLVFGKLSDMYGRRVILMAAVGFILLGAILSAVSQTFIFLIAALSFLSTGQGVIQPLCFSVLGDMYEPAERSRWAGLLNIASAATAFVVPTLSGWFVDTLSWRYIFWLDIPFAILTGIVVMIGLPGSTRREKHNIDFRGSVFLALASSTMILGFSWGGTTYPWNSVQIIGLLGVSIITWILFLRAEANALEPILDMQVLTNRTFIIASAAAFLSIFGFTAITVYFPLFVQGVQGVSATMSGKIITPFSIFTALMGIPAGLLIAKTKRYKWMYVSGYAILAVVMFGMLALKSETPVGWGFLITAMTGFGLGTIPTINALVVQYAVPRRLLGVATGALYFFVMMGRSVAPAILGSVMNSIYAKTLSTSLPGSLQQVVGGEILASLGNPRILLSPSAMADLQNQFGIAGGQAPLLFKQTVTAIRSSLESALLTIFLVGAVMMLASFLLILTIPEIPFDNDSHE
jgi:MFS family permease